MSYSVYLLLFRSLLQKPPVPWKDTSTYKRKHLRTWKMLPLKVRNIKPEFKEKGRRWGQRRHVNTNTRTHKHARRGEKAEIVLHDITENHPLICVFSIFTLTMPQLKLIFMVDRIWFSLTNHWRPKSLPESKLLFRSTLMLSHANMMVLLGIWEQSKVKTSYKFGAIVRIQVGHVLISKKEDSWPTHEEL